MRLSEDARVSGSRDVSAVYASGTSVASRFFTHVVGGAIAFGVSLALALFKAFELLGHDGADALRHVFLPACFFA